MMAEGLLTEALASLTPNLSPTGRGEPSTQVEVVAFALSLKACYNTHV
jgi:hypothetical protein